MEKLEFDVIFDEEEFFDETIQKQDVEGHDVKSPKQDAPKPECVFSKKELSRMAERSIQRARKKKERESRAHIAAQNQDFEKTVEALCDNIIEWCNYEAACGNWRYVHDMSQFDSIYFQPVCDLVRIKMVGVIIIPRKGKSNRSLAIEWGSNQA